MPLLQRRMVVEKPCSDWEGLQPSALRLTAQHPNMRTPRPSGSGKESRAKPVLLCASLPNHLFVPDSEPMGTHSCARCASLAGMAGRSTHTAPLHTHTKIENRLEAPSFTTLAACMCTLPLRKRNEVANQTENTTMIWLRLLPKRGHYG